jgi:hypothetical protein
MGMVLVDLAVAEAAGVGNYTVAAKKNTSATAKYKSIYCELLPKRRGLRGLPRLAFSVDLRSTYYRCACGKHLHLKAGYVLLKRNYCYC